MPPDSPNTPTRSVGARMRSSSPVSSVAPAPDVLALDFDGVLCDGMREYFEASRRTYARVWPEEPRPSDTLSTVFARLRPVNRAGDAAFCSGP